MELIEIQGLFEMDYGAPSPVVIATDNALFITFYADEESSSPEPQMRNTVYDRGIISLKFELCLKHSFGIPGTETISGHPYYKLGMRSCTFYELKDSDLIEELQKIGEVHPYYNPEKWKEYKHYILTFHDNIFECVAKGFEIREENASMHQQTSTILNELSADEF